MRAGSGVVVVTVLGACVTGAGDVARPAAGRAGALVLERAATIACAVAHGPGCEVVETASEFAALQARLEPAIAAQLPACDFTVARLVVAWLRGPGLEPPVSVSLHSEEGVDVVVLVPVGGGGAERTLLHAFVVPLRPAQLAVVARIGAGPGHETTLAVFPGR